MFITPCAKPTSTSKSEKKQHIDPGTDHTLLVSAVFFPFLSLCTSLPFLAITCHNHVSAGSVENGTVPCCDVPVAAIQAATKAAVLCTKRSNRQRNTPPGNDGGNLKGWNSMIQKNHKCIKVSHLTFHYKSIPPPNQEKKGKKKQHSGQKMSNPKTWRLATSPPFFGAFRFAFSTTWWIHANEETVPAQILRHWLPWEKRNTGGF